MPRQLILASSSPYRKQLLARLGIPFKTISPTVDELPAPGETAHQLVKRLSVAKAKTVASAYPHSVVIGSDQTADLNGQLLGKPGTVESACHQLAQCSGQFVIFHTGLSLVSPGSQEYRRVETRIKFRKLSGQQISQYVKFEQPLNCAGSFKVESRGIILFEEVASSDPTALIGLPLITLTNMLLSIGYDPLTAI